jgi:hypothetical protein
MQPVRDGRQGCGRSEKVLCHVSPILDPRVKEDRLRLLRWTMLTALSGLLRGHAESHAVLQATGM